MRAHPAAIVDHEAQGYQEKAGTEQDEWFQAPHAVHSHANDDARQRGAKAVQRSYTVRCFVALVKRHT